MPVFVWGVAGGQDIEMAVLVDRQKGRFEWYWRHEIAGRLSGRLADRERGGSRRELGWGTYE